MFKPSRVNIASLGWLNFPQQQPIPVVSGISATSENMGPRPVPAQLGIPRHPPMPRIRSNRPCAEHNRWADILHRSAAQKGVT